MGAAHRRGADLGWECEISSASPLGRPVDLGIGSGRFWVFLLKFKVEQWRI
jgi:hypothetical protein